MKKGYKLCEKGFELQGKGPTIYYLDCWGKDVGFERWRIYAYYKPGFAKTLFFPTEADYLKFISTNQNKVYHDYQEFETAYNKQK